MALVEERHPDYKFNLAEDPNQQGWDLHGVGPEGSAEIYVQVKTRVAGDASEVKNALQQSPDFVFALNARNSMMRFWSLTLTSLTE